jgi:LuxR family maltose regulon positive regulatory protein
VVWQRPKLLVVQAWILYRQSRFGALDRVLDAAEACLEQDAGDLAAPESQALRGQIATLHSATAYLLREDFEGSLKAAEGALARLPATERGTRSTALGFWAFAKQAMGAKEAAINRLEEVLGQPGPHDLAETQIFLGLCLTHYLAGELPQMLAAAGRFLALAAEIGESNAIVGANWVAGLCHYELNDLAAAAHHFGQVFELRYRSNFAATSSSTLGLARVHQVRGEWDEAQALLDGLRAEILRLGTTDLSQSLDAIQAHQRLLQADAASALRWARALDARTLVESPFWVESPALVQARILIAAGTDDEVRGLASALEARLAAARERHSIRRAVQVLAHLALAHDRLGGGKRALARLQEALTLAEPGGFVRSFVDAGPRLGALLRQVRQPSVNPHYLAELLAAFEAAPGYDVPGLLQSRTPQHGTGPALLLTRREEEILRLMQDGLTNKEIAGQLVISVHTVKRHATNIYHKLDASGRRQAIHKAQQLGILPTN